MRKIMELKKSGKTMVYVSHNPLQVLRVCNRGIVLEKGEVVFEGPAEDAVKKLGYDLDEDEDD
jgi:ABC-2 type transport system ATP-binding protein